MLNIMDAKYKEFTVLHSVVCNVFRHSTFHFITNKICGCSKLDYMLFQFVPCEHRGEAIPFPHRLFA